MDITIIGYLAGILTTFASLPQLIKSIKTGNTEGISPYFVVIFTIGLFLWLVYGILKMDYPIIIFNIISLIFWIPILYLTVLNNFKRINKKNKKQSV